MDEQKQLRLVIESIHDYAVFTLTPTNRIKSWNTGAEHITGYTEADVLGQDAAILFIPEDRANGAPEQELHQARETGRAADERWHLRKDGTRFYASGVLSPMYDATGTLQGFVKVLRDLTEWQQAIESLAASQGRLQALFTHSLDAIMLADNHAHYVDANPAACALTGYTAEELRHMTIIDLTPAPMDERMRMVWHTFLATGQARGEYTLLRKDGSLVETEFRSVANIVPGLHMSMLRDITERKRAEAALRQAHDTLEQQVRERTEELAIAQEQMQMVLHDMVLAQEEERWRIARALHDQLGQPLTALRMRLATLASQAATHAPLADTVTRLQQIADQIDQNVDLLALNLRPAMLDDLGLAITLQQHVEAWSAQNDIVAELQVLGTENHPIPPAISIVLYRVVQEALMNVRKHATAQHVSIILEERDHQMLLIIEDDGQGFDHDAMPQTSDAHRRLGLLSMRERVASVGGTLTIESALGAGTTLYIRIPLVPPG